MGTRNLNVVIPAELAGQNPKSVNDAKEEYNEYKALKRQDDYSPN